MKSKEIDLSSLIPAGWKVNSQVVNPNFGDQISNQSLFESFLLGVQTGRRSIKGAQAEMKLKKVLIRANSTWK